MDREEGEGLGDHLARILKRKQEVDRDRLRDAAPALLEVLEMVKDFDDFLPFLPHEIKDKMDSAIASARGVKK